MSRLIDADALIEEMVKIPGNRWNTKTFGEVLDRVPTVAMGTDHITIQWTPEIDKLARDVAFRGLNEFSFMGKSIREWIEIILEQNARTAWVSVEDRLPDAAGYECLVYAVNENTHQTHVFTAFTGYGEPGWWTSNVHYMSRAKSPSDNRLHPALRVTHWMPLPEPPEVEA